MKTTSKRYDLSLYVLNNDKEYELDIRVKTNSLKYAIKKLYGNYLDSSGSIRQKYYFGYPKLIDNKTNQEVVIFTDDSSNLVLVRIDSE